MFKYCPIHSLPTPPPTYFLLFLILYNTCLYIVQYLLFLVHISIPHITPYPQHCVHIHPDPPPIPRPDPPTRPPLIFFLNFHKNCTSSFTSTLTPRPDSPPRPPPPNFFFYLFLNFHKNHFTVYIYLDPPTRNFPPPHPPKKKMFFF